VWWLMIWRLAFAHRPSLPVDSSVIGYCKMHYNFIMSPRVVYVANSLEVDNPGLKKAPFVRVSLRRKPTSCYVRFEIGN
jgi:hypothetical protein